MGKIFNRKVIIYLILTFAFTLILPNRNVKADTKYDVTINYGIDGKYKSQNYIPVTVAVKDLQEDFKGEIEVRVASNSQGGYDSYAMEVTGAAGESIEVIIPIKLLQDSSKAEICLVEDKNVVYKKDLIFSTGRITEGNAFTGLLTDDPTALGYLGDVYVETQYSNVAKMDTITLDNSDLLNNYLNIDGLDIIIVNNFNMASLNEQQYNSLNSWVNNGGTLLIAAGANEGKTINNIDKNFLNITSNGTNELDTSISRLIVSDLNIGNADVVLSDGSPDLVYSVERGQGKIYITTFDLGLEPFISYPYVDNVIASIFKDTFNKVYDESYNNGYWEGNYQISNLLSYIPIDQPLTLGVLITILVIYCLLIGVVVYLILKKINKRELCWIILPLVAIGFTAVIYIAGGKMKVKDFVMNSANIINVDSDGKGYVNTYLGITSKYKSDLIVEKPADLDMEYTKSNDYYYYGSTDMQLNDLRIKTTYRNNNLDYTFAESQASEVRTFKILGTEIIVPKIESSLSLVSGNLTGTVKNNLDSDIRKLIVSIGDSVWDLGTVKKGEEITVSDLSIATAYGISAFAEAMDSEYYQAKWDSSKNHNDPKYKGIIRNYNLLSAINTTVSSDTGANIIAITDMPIDYDLNIGSNSISKYDITAIIQDIEINFKDSNGYISLPEGYIKSQLIYSDYEVNYDSNNNGYLYGNGEAIFDYKINDNIAIEEITVKQAFDRWGYQYGMSNEYTIYNYTTNDYDSLNLSAKDYNTTNIEDYCNDNTVRIKVTLDQNKGEAIVPKIVVKGVEK